MPETKVTFNQVRYWGMVTAIPFIFSAGPLAGYFLGDYLKKRFGGSESFLYICVITGLAVSLFEVTRIINLIKKEMK